MTHPPDLVERVAKAIYNAGPLYELDGFMVISWEQLVIDEGDYCPISSACRDKARAALTEACSWIAETPKPDEGGVTARALRLAAEQPLQFNPKAEGA